MRTLILVPLLVIALAVWERSMRPTARSIPAVRSRWNMHRAPKTRAVLPFANRRADFRTANKPAFDGRMREAISSLMGSAAVTRTSLKLRGTAARRRTFVNALLTFRRICRVRNILTLALTGASYCPCTFRVYQGVTV